MDSPDGHNKLKFIITSRTYDDFELDKPRNGLTKYTTHVQIPAIGEDIDLVIKERVDQIASDFTPEIRHRIVERLSDKKDRSYLWLALTF